MAISIHGSEDLGKYNSRPLITYQPNKLKQVSSDIIYQSDHIIILDSDSTIGCQE